MRPRFSLSLSLLAATLSAAALADGAAAPAPTAPAPAPAATPAPAAAPASPWARYDELYQRRDESPALKEMYAIVAAELAANPNSYEGWWRRAQLDCWQANGFVDGSELKASVGKQCWDAGEKAVTINPDDVKGQYWATVGMGLYSEGLGILSALSQGIEGKFKNRVGLAIKLDRDYLDGGPVTLFGRFYWKLPWPKRDLDESQRLLNESLAAHPNNLRTRLFLADTLDSQGKKDEAKKMAQSILDAPLGWDKPDDKRNKSMAKKWLDNH